MKQPANTIKVPLAPRAEESADALQCVVNSPRSKVDLLGIHKLSSAQIAQIKHAPKKIGAFLHEAASGSYAKITRNNFKNKSLSQWAYNIAIGCVHACRFCYVPSSQQSGNSKIQKPGRRPNAINAALKKYGVLDPDSEWGEYVLLRPWDEKTFLESLARAEKTPLDKLNRDGNRAVIFCSTTDPFQTLYIPPRDNESPEENARRRVKQELLNGQRTFLVRRALELILEQSTINVRILTRSSPNKAEWEVLQALAKEDRLAFGVSLPTLEKELLEVYEPKAPGFEARLRTLEAAKHKEIPRFVAMAPTYPEASESDLRALLTKIQEFNPITVFHEPINIRAENVARIEANAAAKGRTLKTDVFKTPSAWRQYAIDSLNTVHKLAIELKMVQCLHLWPDAHLESNGQFLKLRKMKRAGLKLTRLEKQRYEQEDQRIYEDQYLPWLNGWWDRISEWPGKP